MSVGRASRSMSSILLALMILAPDTVAKDREANVELPVTWKFGENYWLERIKERRQYNGTSLQLSPCAAAGPPGGAGGVYGPSGGLVTQVTALVAPRAADGLDDALQAPRHSRARAAQMDNRAGPGRARAIDVSGQAVARAEITINLSEERGRLEILRAKNFKYYFDDGFEFDLRSAPPMGTDAGGGDHEFGSHLLSPLSARLRPLYLREPTFPARSPTTDFDPEFAIPI